MNFPTVLLLQHNVDHNLVHGPCIIVHQNILRWSSLKSTDCFYTNINNIFSYICVHLNKCIMLYILGYFTVDLKYKSECKHYMENEAWRRIRVSQNYFELIICLAGQMVYHTTFFKVRFTVREAILGGGLLIVFES